MNPSENFSTDKRDNQDIEKVFGSGSVRKPSETTENRGKKHCMKPQIWLMEYNISPRLRKFWDLGIDYTHTT